MKKYYSINAIEDFISENCVDCLFLSDSVIGLGNQIWTMKNGRYFIVREHYLTPWTSGHTIRRVSKLSKRLIALCENTEENLLLQD